MSVKFFFLGVLFSNLQSIKNVSEESPFFSAASWLTDVQAIKRIVKSILSEVMQTVDMEIEGLLFSQQAKMMLTRREHPHRQQLLRAQVTGSTILISQQDNLS